MKKTTHKYLSWSPMLCCLNFLQFNWTIEVFVGSDEYLMMNDDITTCWKFEVVYIIPIQNESFQWKFSCCISLIHSDVFWLGLLISIMAVLWLYRKKHSKHQWFIYLLYNAMIKRSLYIVSTFRVNLFFNAWNFEIMWLA